MKFLSDVLAKAGLVVDGVVTFNNTATGQTPDANDNSTKLATTAWVRGFVTPYSLPIASGVTLGGIKVGSGLAIDGTGVLSVSASGVGAIRALQQITATTGQTVFTVSGGYTPGLIDVFLNGVLLTPTAITATNGTTFTLADAAIVNDLLDIFVYNPIYNGFITSTDQVPEGSVNLYFTNTRARAAISLTVTGSSGASTYSSSTGVLNVPTYTLDGLGGVPTSRTLTINGVTYDLTANRSWSALPVGGVAGQLLAKVDGTDYNAQWINEAPAASYTSQVKHVVKSSQAITKGQAVYVSSADGTNMIVSKASNATEGTSSKTMGLLESTVAINGTANVVTEGLLAGLDTTGANAAGDPVWLGTDGNLIYGLTNKPSAPAHLVFIGVVTRRNANNGEIFVKVQNGYELDELHDLSVKNPSDGDMIKYVASTGLWTKVAASTTNIVEGTNLYYTDARVGTYLTNNSYATQTYVNTAVSNLVDAAPGTLDTLNELAAALGDDPNFATTVATSIGTKVPQTRTLTINGTSYDLSADRSWTIASGVTSFNTRTGAITSVSGDYTTAQVTESGNLYYTDARVRLAISLTTTGTSGAATYDNVTGVLNIPQYQGGVTSFNTRTGAITLSSTDVTTALGYTPVTNARTLTINGEAYDLTADRTWTVGVNSSARTIQTYTATASQTTFTVTGGYVAGLVDVFINGVRLTSADFTATNGTTVVLTTGTGVNNIVDVIKYTSAFTASSALRQVTYFTATAGQTTFTVSYTPGLIDVFYNGSKLASSEYTATNGTTVVLTNAAVLNDALEIIAYAYSVGAFTGQAQLNGTGFVKVNGTTVTYDNSTYLTTSTASSTYATISSLSQYLPLIGGTLTGGLNGTTATFSSNVTMGGNDGYATRLYVRTEDAANTPSLILSKNIGSTSAEDIFRVQSYTNGVGFVTTASIKANGSASFGGNILISGNIELTNGANRQIIIGSVTNYNYRLRTDSDDFVITEAGVTDRLRYSYSNVRWTITGALTVSASAIFSSSATASGLNAKGTTLNNSNAIRLLRADNTEMGYIGWSNENTNNSTWLFKSSNGNEIGFSPNGTNQSVIFNTDGSAFFNYPILGSRSFVFRTVSGRPLSLETVAITGIHALYLRANDSGRHLISSNYLSGGVYLPLALSGRENDADLVLSTSGNVLIGTTTDSGYRLNVNGASYLNGYNYASSIQYFRPVSDTVNPAGGEGVLIFSGGQAAIRMNSAYTMNFDVYNGGTQHTPLQIRQAGNTVRVNSENNQLSLAIAYQGAEHGYLGATSGNGRSLLAYSQNGGYVYLSSSSTWVAASDVNRKKNFESYNKGLAEICSLQPTLFNLKTQSDDEPKIAGLIAQQVGEHIQEAFSDGEFIGIDYNVLTVTIINAIKELKAELDELKSKN
jgi:hypothetical protein